MRCQLRVMKCKARARPATPFRYFISSPEVIRLVMMSVASTHPGHIRSRLVGADLLSAGSRVPRLIFKRSPFDKSHAEDQSQLYG